MGCMSSLFIDNYRFLARYNHWFNERLYDACEKLTDEERKRDRGAFFGSIHKTLNHVVWADQLWLQRFAQSGTPFPSLGGGLLDLPASAVHATVLFAASGAATPSGDPCPNSSLWCDQRRASL